MPVTRHPLHRTERAEPQHTAPALGVRLKLPAEQGLSDGSYLSTVFDSADSQRRAGRIVRVIDYTLQDSATPVQDCYQLVTNLLGPGQAPALERAALYHERWEIEGAFDEFKTHRRANSTVLRSKTPRSGTASAVGVAAGALRHSPVDDAGRLAARARS